LVIKDKIIVFYRGVVCLETSLDIGISVESDGNEADLPGEDLVLNKKLAILNFNTFPDLHVAKNVSYCINHQARLGIKLLYLDQG